MASYYVNRNAQNNGDHEVHGSGCSYMPDAANLQYLGDFNSCRDAVRAARNYYSQTNGCFYCSYECHTT